MSKEVLKLALEALNVLLDEWTPARQAQLKGMAAVTALEEALKQEQGEIKCLTAALEKANALAEHFEREWYMRCDELEELKQEQGEPCGRLESDPEEGHVFVPRIDGDWSMLGKDLYTTPLQRKPLDCFETEKLAKQCGVEWTTHIDKLCKLAAAHGIKE